MSESKSELNVIATDGQNAFWAPSHDPVRADLLAPEINADVLFIGHEYAHSALLVGKDTDNAARNDLAAAMREYQSDFRGLIREAKLLQEEGAELLDEEMREALQRILGRFDKQGSLYVFDELQLTGIVLFARTLKA